MSREQPVVSIKEIKNLSPMAAWTIYVGQQPVENLIAKWMDVGGFDSVYDDRSAANGIIAMHIDALGLDITAQARDLLIDLLVDQVAASIEHDWDSHD